MVIPSYLIMTYRRQLLFGIPNNTTVSALLAILPFFGLTAYHLVHLKWLRKLIKYWLILGQALPGFLICMK